MMPAVPAAGAPAGAPPLATVAAMEPELPTPAVELPAAAPEPPAAVFDEVTIPGGSVIGFRLDSTVSSATARVEDRVTARVTRDVTVDGRVAVPAGSRLEGTITAVQPAGKLRERARIGLRFNTLVFADNSHLPIQTEAIFRDGDPVGNEAASKIGASAVVGAILGAVIGGKKGAAIGSTAGAAGGTAAVMAADTNDAVIAAGTPLTVRLTSPSTVLVQRN
jgi:hypothetical protein